MQTIFGSFEIFKKVEKISILVFQVFYEQSKQRTGMLQVNSFFSRRKVEKLLLSYSLNGLNQGKRIRDSVIHILVINYLHK